MKFLALLGFVFLLASCNQNPYPTAGQYFSQKPKDPPQYLPPYVINSPDLMEFYEGQESIYEFKVNVPPPGTPVFVAKELGKQGLPKGMTVTLKDDTVKLTWKPDYDQGNDPQNAKVTSRKFQLHFVLGKLEEKITYIEKKPTAVVFDVPQKFEVKVLDATGNPSPTSTSVAEGQTLVQKIRISSDDFPKGPFQLKVPNLPSGANLQVDPNDSSVFNFSYTPSYRTVRLTQTNQTYIQQNLEFIAITPRGQETSTSQSMIVYDRRQFAQTYAPGKIVSNGVVNFVITTEDLNGEVEPRLSLLDPVKFGDTPTIEKVEGIGGSLGNPTASYQVTWKNIPLDKIKSGITEALKFQVCVLKYSNSYTHCNFLNIDVQFTATLNPPPIIDRSKWPAGKRIFTKIGATYYIDIPVRDAQSPNQKVDVSFTPADFATNVTWTANRFRFTPSKPGLIQFQMVATSNAGAVATESFYFESLPADWASTLLLGQSMENKEVEQTFDFVQKASVVNPYLADQFDERLFQYRNAVIIGTNILTENKFEKLEDLLLPIKYILLLSPKASNIVSTTEAKVWSELQGQGLQFGKNFSDLTKGSVTDFKLLPMTNAFTAAKNPVKLAGTLTDYSGNPQSINVTGTKCQKLFKLVRTSPAEEIVVAASCPRKNGDGMFVVTGFEWADIKTDPAEKTLKQTWFDQLFQRVLKTKKQIENLEE